MKRLLLLLPIITTLTISGHIKGQEPLSITRFQGINNILGELDCPPNASMRAHNVNFSSGGINTISRRYGADSVSTLPGMDSITGLTTCVLADGRKFLALAGDSAGVGWGKLYLTNYNSLRLDSARAIYDYWSGQNPTTFQMFDNKLWIVNGAQKGVVYNPEDGEARSWPLPAPGEPRIVPIAGSGELKGEYRYFFTMDCSGNGVHETGRAGYISQPVWTNGRMLITDIGDWYADSAHTGPSTLIIQAWRTKANPGRIDKTDTFYYVGLTTIDTTMSGVVLIDSIPDTSLDATYMTTSSLIQHIGRDDTLGLLYRYGAPVYIYDYTRGYYNGDSSLTGIFGGLPEQYYNTGFTKAVVYTTTIFDTVLQIESDTGRALFVFNDTSLQDSVMLSQVRVSIPPLPTNLNNCVRNLYRATFARFGADTSIKVFGPVSSVVAHYVRKVWEDKNKDVGWEKYFMVCDAGNCNVYMHSIIGDSLLLTPFYLVDQISPDSMYYTDSLRWDSVQLCKAFINQTSLSLLDGIVAYNGYLYGRQGSLVARSALDSAQKWGAFDIVSVNPDDGQRINGLWPTKDALRVGKDNATFNVITETMKPEIESHVGCIAPKSIISTPSGTYYLSKRGFELENDGLSLERTYVVEPVSAPMDNLKKLPDSLLQDAIAAYIPKEELSLLCVGDTSYVWDERAKSWATWSMPFRQWCLYDTSSTVAGSGENFYFVRPNSATLCRYHPSDSLSTTWTGSGTKGNIIVDWESGALFKATTTMPQITGATLFAKNGELGNYLYLNFYDQDGNYSGQNDPTIGTSLLFDSLRNRWQFKDKMCSPAMYYRLALRSATAIANTSVDRIDVWYTEGEKIR